MATSAKYGKDSNFKEYDLEVDRTTSCPDGLHDEDRYLPGLVRNVRRTDSDTDMSRYERSFELYQSNQGKSFTWKLYLRILQQMWPSSYASKLKSHKKTLPHNLPKSYISDFEEFHKKFEDFQKRQAQKSTQSKDYRDKTLQRSIALEDFVKETSRRTGSVDFCRKSTHRVPEDSRQKTFQRRKRNEDSHEKTSRRRMVNEDSYEKAYQTSSGYDSHEKTSQRRMVNEDSHKKAYQRSTVYKDPCVRKSQRSTEFKDSYTTASQRSILFEDSPKKSHRKSRASEEFCERIPSRRTVSEDSYMETPQESIRERKSLFRREVDSDNESISSVDTILFVTPVVKMKPHADASRYITPLQSLPRKKTMLQPLTSSAKCNTASKDYHNRTPQGRKSKQRSSFRKEPSLDAESISSFDSTHFVTPMVKMVRRSEVSESESSPVKKMHRSVSSKNCSTPSKSQGSKWQRRSFFKKKVNFDTQSISSIDSTFLPLTPLVKKLYTKIINDRVHKRMEETPVKHKKKNKAPKKCPQPFEDEPIYAKINKKRPQPYGEDTKPLTPADIRARCKASCSSRDIPNVRDEFTNDLQYEEIKHSFWGRLKSFIKNEFKISKKNFKRKSSQKRCEIEV